jgi:hypothetical protein
MSIEFIKDGVRFTVDREPHPYFARPQPTAPEGGDVPSQPQTPASLRAIDPRLGYGFREQPDLVQASLRRVIEAIRDLGNRGEAVGPIPLRQGTSLGPILRMLDAARGLDTGETRPSVEWIDRLRRTGLPFIRTGGAPTVMVLTPSRPQ